MARTSRQDRRQRRAQSAGTPPLQPARKPPPPPAPPTAIEGAGAEPSPERPVEAGGGGGIPGLRFVQEAIAELKKVEWPGQQAVVSGTAVVLVACLLVGVFLYANDRLWSYFVQHVLVR